MKSFIDDDAAALIQTEQNRLLDAAEDAGFQKTNSVRAKLLNLYAENGLEKMLHGFDACAKHGVSNIAYLEAVLKGEPRKEKVHVSGQEYGQRDYTGENERVLSEHERQMEEFMKGRETG